MRDIRQSCIPLCPKDGTALLPGIYLKHSTASSPYIGDGIVSRWMVWDGTLAECLKCPVCGYSVTNKKSAEAPIA